MRIINFGSLNLDFVYAVDHIVKPGETISSYSLNLYCGGKGLNQSVALAKAGVKVYHAGLIGADGEILRETLKQNGIDHNFVKTIEERSGNAIIQVDKNGENSIVLFGGANQKNTLAFIGQVLDQFGAGDLLLLQNEVNLLPEMIDYAFNKGISIALNPSPFNKNITESDLSKVSYLLLNEVEGEQLTGRREPLEILDAIRERYPNLNVVLTLGKAGAWYQDKQNRLFQKAMEVAAVDTTSAGDAFTGYFLAAVAGGRGFEQALSEATVAAGLTVSKPGAADSIPRKNEVFCVLTLQV
jgi:ribokinase